MNSFQTIRSDEVFTVEMDGEYVAIDVEVDDNFPSITTYRFSKEAAQALGMALLAAASDGGTEHALFCRWDGREVVVSMTRELSGERWVAVDGGVFNASEAKALLAAIASCVAAMDASSGARKHRVSASWNDGVVEVMSVPGWLQIDYDRWCLGFNASEAKALLAAIASCVAAMDASNGGDGDGR